MTKKKKPSELTIPRYEGLIARTCGLLNIMPHGDDMSLDRFKALEAWCDEKQKENLERNELFGEER